MGSNDGILTVVGVLFSTAAATTDNFLILIAGFADLLACAFSMAAGEYASVSAQRETERAVVGSEQANINQDKNYSINIIKKSYIDKGVSEDTATKIAKELIAKKNWVRSFMQNIR
ncbi:hypothetical protein Q757_05920 [Oenococcus alcoholitolerans]|uniref:VIT family protein n=1 Tax=Oenococcus alcoholitolerans TaxID=931074 RepID=A0ABR4XQN1_9LACO|nr:hypothetical protein Q757_05920 [Oenococcus alcoholitolerans]